jgi:hypothetical protein
LPLRGRVCTVAVGILELACVAGHLPAMGDGKRSRLLVTKCRCRRLRSARRRGVRFRQVAAAHHRRDLSRPPSCPSSPQPWPSRPRSVSSESARP